MKKNYLWGICAVLALSSCSQDEVVSVPQTGISYSVVTDKASRAQDVFCNKTLPDYFYVSALVGQNTYFKEDSVKVTTVNDVTTCTQTNSRYWPEEGVLNFYAYANGHTSTRTSAKLDEKLSLNGSPIISGYEVSTTLKEQYDLIYAVKLNQSKPKDKNTKVGLNFRHALSQIVFQAWNKNPNIYVEISGVEIHNVANKGDFTFPSSATDDNIEDHDQNGEDATPDAPGTDTDITIANQGTWTLKNTTADYAVSFDSIAVKYNEGKVSLTNNVVFQSDNDVTDKITEATYKERAMLLLPQGTTEKPVAAWTKPENWNWKDNKLTETEEGAFFFVKCKIWNVASSDGNVAKDENGNITDVLVYSSEGEAKNILIPVEIVWNQGHKYVYTFVFKKDGDGGIDPDDGEPVLIPIEYTVTVDDFTNETEQEVEMNSTKQENNN